MYQDRDINVMDAMFKGKLKDMNPPKYKTVELGQGSGIGQCGTYAQYEKKLSRQSNKGIISLGKSVELIDKQLKLSKDNILSPNEQLELFTDSTDKFILGDIPKVAILLNNIINETSIDVIWKTISNHAILEQHYDIPSPYSMQYDWWDTYTVYFTGPEDLKVGEYKTLIEINELGLESNKTLNGELTFEIR